MGFISRSLLLLFALYGLVFAIGDVYLLRGGAPIWWGIILVVALVGVQYLLAPWLIEKFYRIDWDEGAIPASRRAFVERMCREHNLPAIKMGIIQSGTPNAFAFGRLQTDARIVVTSGLLDVLSEDEVDAVLAHEIGHVAHHDFAVMALAAVAPMLLYQVYAWTHRINHLRPLAYSAYAAYWIGRFLVLLLNRIREYGADHFSAQATLAPNALCRALVKIAYGRVLEAANAKQLVKKSKSSDEKTAARKSAELGRTLALLGIMSAGGSAALDLSTTPEQAARVMRWDLVNPWSRFYELGSTHPLPAMRLRALNREAEIMGQGVAYPLPQDAKIRWAAFPFEFLIWVSPWVCAVLFIAWSLIELPLRHRGIILPSYFKHLLVVVFGLTWAERIAFRYRGTFRRAQVDELIEDLDVSQMQPRAVEIEGEVIGEGIPGAFWSPDLVMRDETGMMFLLYRSSIPLGRLFFAIGEAHRFIGERVTVQGWYRRGLKPYIEISRIEARVSKLSGEKITRIFGSEGATRPLEYEQVVGRSYSRWIQLAASAACTAVGIIWMLKG
jgi:Zn-dependent protease with chaperone function